MAAIAASATTTGAVRRTARDDAARPNRESISDRDASATPTRSRTPTARVRSREPAALARCRAWRRPGVAEPAAAGGAGTTPIGSTLAGSTLAGWRSADSAVASRAPTLVRSIATPASSISLATIAGNSMPAARSSA
jgi:hypothetical protein